MSSAFGNGLATLWLACRKAILWLIFSAVYAHRGAFNRFFTRNGVSWISTSENREWCFGFFFTSGEHTLALPHGHGSKFHEHRYTHHLRVMKNQQRVISWSTWWMLSQVNMYIYVYVYTKYRYILIIAAHCHILSFSFYFKRQLGSMAHTQVWSSRSWRIAWHCNLEAFFLWNYLSQSAFTYIIIWYINRIDFNIGEQAATFSTEVWDVDEEPLLRHFCLEDECQEVAE